MKKILVFIFCAFSGLCFCATFNDIPFSEVFSEMMFSVEDVEPIEEEFSSQSAIVKDFFESIPADFVVTPEFKLANDDIENLEFKYSLRIENKNNLFFIHDFTLDETGLHGTAEFGVNLNQNPHYSYAVLVFENFCIQHDGTFESGISKLGLGTVEGVADFWLEDSYLKKDGDSYVVVCENPFIDSAAFYNGERLHVGETVFDMNFNIISSKVYDVPQSFDTDELGYGVTLTSIKWDGESFYANGQLRIPGLDLYAEFNNYEIFIGSAEFYTENADSEYTFKYEDYTFFGKNVSMNPLEVRISDAGIIWRDKKIPFGELVFSFYYDNWDLEEECSFSSYDDDDIEDYAHILYDDDQISGYEFDNDRLFIYIWSKFPKGSGQALSYKLAAYPDGRFEPVLDGYYKKVFYCGNTNVSSSLMNVDTEMWELYNADVALPYNSCLTDLTISNLKLFYDGTIEHGNAVGKSEFCGMNYFIDELTFVDDGIITSGILQLPGSLPSSYSALNLTVEKLYIGFDGSVKELVTRSSDARGCALSDSFWLVSKGCHIEVEQTRNEKGELNPATCWLCFDDVSISLPSAYIVDANITVEKLKYKLDEKGGFEFADVWVPGGFTMGISGMQLYVVDGTGMENGLQFTGMLSLPNGDEIPEFLRGMVTPAVIGIDFDGKICRSEVALGLIEGSLETANDEIGVFTLGNTAAHFATSEFDPTYLALVADSGAFVFTDTLPAWLSGTEVRIGSFVYDFNKLRYTSLSGMQYCFGLPEIVPEMTGVYATIDYSYVNPDEDSLIAITGDLVSPAPVSWGDSTPEGKSAKGTISFDLAGRTKDFSVQYEY